MDFGSKRLDVPCSEEAYLRVNLPDRKIGEVHWFNGGHGYFLENQ